MNSNEEKLRSESAVATHRETWYAISAVKKDRRYTDYIDNVSEEELAGGVNMDAVLDRIEARGEARGEVQGRERVNRLALMLAEEGKIEEFIKSAGNKDYQQQLFKEYGLEDE